LGAPEDADADEVLNYIKLYIESFDGAKRSAHILFESDDEKAAQEILDKINAGELDFAQAAKENSKDTSAENGGDVGWDRLATFVEAYQGALDELELNQVSGLVASEYGIHIIKCTEVFAAPEEITEESQVPQEYVEAIRNMIQGMNQEDTYAAWYEAFREAADIEINAMPEKVPYNLDIEKYAIEHEGDEGFDLEDYLNMTGEDWSSEQEGSEEGEGENPEAAEGAPNS
jgi:foldase protein PrsA